MNLTLEAIQRLSPPNRIDIARDGAQALDYLKTASRDRACPALVLLDVKLPRVTGHDVLRQARGRRQFCQMPIVMLSASAAPAGVQAAYAFGANAYLVKPLGFRALVEALAVTLQFWTVRNSPPPMRAP